VDIRHKAGHDELEPWSFRKFPIRFSNSVVAFRSWIVIASASEPIHIAAQRKEWIASSRSLSSGAHSRDPLAPRNDGSSEHAFAFSRRPAPEVVQEIPPLENRGAGKAGCPLHPQPRVRK
jgi:hypothetical protein